jgi:hypothetical protein
MTEAERNLAYAEAQVNSDDQIGPLLAWLYDPSIPRLMVIAEQSLADAAKSAEAPTIDAIVDKPA